MSPKKRFTIVLPHQNVVLTLKLKKLKILSLENELNLLIEKSHLTGILPLSSFAYKNLLFSHWTRKFSRKPWKWFRKNEWMPVLKSKWCYADLFTKEYAKWRLTDYIIEIMRWKKKDSLSHIKRRFNNFFSSLPLERQLQLQNKFSFHFNQYLNNTNYEKTFYFMKEISQTLLDLAPFDFWTN